MKKQISTFAFGMLTMALIGSLGVGALAAASQFTITVDPINIQVNGATFQPKDANGNDVPVFAYNGTTYAPLRALAEAYGLEVGYDAEAKMATVGTKQTASTDQEKLIDKAGKEITSYDTDIVSVTVNGKQIGSSDPSSIVYAGRTYVNVKAVGEALSIDSSALDFSELDTLSLNGCIYATARDFAEVSNAQVQYDQANKVLMISKEKTEANTSIPSSSSCEIGKQYSTDSGYGVTINSASTNTVKGVPTFTFKYTLKNLTSSEYLDEDTFTIGFTDGTSTNQGGIYMDGMYPGDTLTKTYSLILNDKTVSYILFNDGDSFFFATPRQNDLESHLVWYVK